MGKKSKKIKNKIKNKIKKNRSDEEMLEMKEEKKLNSRKKFIEEIKVESKNSEISNTTISKKLENYVKAREAEMAEDKRRVKLYEAMNKLEKKKKQEEERE